MIRVVHPGSRIWMLTSTHPGSRIQGSKRHRIPDPDPQHCMKDLILQCNMTFVKLYLLHASVADQDPGSVAFLTPGSGIKDKHPVSYSWEIGTVQVSWVKNFINSFLRIRIMNLVSSGSGMEKLKSDPGSWILDPWYLILDPGSEINIPDPQHCCTHILMRLSSYSLRYILS